MKKFTVLGLMIAPFLNTGLYATDRNAGAIVPASGAELASLSDAGVLAPQQKDRERADAHIDIMMTQPLQETANACLLEWGFTEGTQEKDPRALLAFLVSQGMSKNHLNSQYGYTFAEKNNSVIDDFINSVANWNEGLRIADVGAGKGVSALYLADKIFTLLQERRITPSSPIQIFVSDLIYGNHLRNLAAVVNTACCPHIRMAAQTIDLTDSYQFEAGPVDHIFAFNVFHYLPNTRWGHVMKCMAANLKPKGAITIIVDELKGDDFQTSYADLAKEKGNPVNGMAMKLEKKNPFHIPSLVLYDPENGGVEKGFRIPNYSPHTPVLNVEAEPGADYGIERIDVENLKQVLVAYAKTQLGPINKKAYKELGDLFAKKRSAEHHQIDIDSLEREVNKEYKKRYPNTEHIRIVCSKTGEINATTVTKLIEKFQAGQVRVLLGAYSFTLQSLRTALSNTKSMKLMIKTVRHIFRPAAPTQKEILTSLFGGTPMQTRQQRVAIAAVLEKR